MCGEGLRSQLQALSPQSSWCGSGLGMLCACIPHSEVREANASGTPTPPRADSGLFFHSEPQLLSMSGHVSTAAFT